MAGVIYGKDARPSEPLIPTALMALLAGQDRKRKLEREAQMMEMQQAGESRDAQRFQTQQEGTMLQRLAAMRQAQIEAAQMREGTPGGSTPMLDGQMGPPEPAAFHTPVKIPGYSDPSTGRSVPDTSITPRTDYGMLDVLRDKKMAEEEAKLPGIMAKAQADTVLAPIDIPELGIRKGQPTDKDTLDRAFKARSDERGAQAGERAAKALEQAAARTGKSEEDRNQREAKLENTRAFSQATTLRQEYNKLTTPARDTERLANAVLKRLGDPSVANNGVFDASLITQLNKVLDPGSVVRESEFDRYSNVGSIRDRLLAKYGRFTEGTRVGPETRKQIIREIQAIADNTKQWGQEQEQRYREIAESNQVPWERVMGKTEATRTTPSGGRVIQGSGKYKGWTIEIQ